MFISGFALFAERRFSWHGQAFTPREIGWLYVYSGLLGIVIQGGLIGRLVKKLTEARVIRLGIVCLGIGYALLGYVEPVGPLLVAVAFSTFGSGVLRPCLTSIATQVIDRSEQGVVLGLTQTISSLASVVAGTLSGWLIERHLLAEWGWVAAAFCVLGLLATHWGSSRYVPAS
jgi:DHA1 family tetracycline resistance protein-like MFS transporter